MKDRELWTRLAKEGEFISFRFRETDKPPTGLVFKLADGTKAIVRPAKDGAYLDVEPHW